MLTDIKNWASILGVFVSLLGAYLSLLVGYPLSFFSAPLWRAWMDIYKGVFGMLLVCMLSLTSPSKVRVYSRHSNMRFRIKRNGLLQSTLSPRTVVMANHQIYSDWMYLWWLTYTAGLEASPIVTLKKSLRNIPILGWAMRWLKFLFLSRKWADDQQNIKEVTGYFAEDKSWPVWMCLFPEGTVYNKNTLARSEEYADSAGISRHLVPKHILLPRVKGLQAILQGLQGSMPVLYDITIVYEPAPPQSMAAETYYSLKRTFLKSLGPETVKLHIREFAMNHIPYKESEEVFTQWLYERWIEKDKIYEDLAAGNLESDFRAEAPVSPNSWFEIYKCFQMPLILLLLGRLVYKLILALI